MRIHDRTEDEATKEELRKWKEKMSPYGWWKEEELIEDPD